MPALEGILEAANAPQQDGQIAFPPVTRDHILHCSYDYWFPKYRTSCIRSRVIPLSRDFVSYIREDGIILADDEPGNENDSDDDDWEPTVPSSEIPAPPRNPGDADNDSDDDDEDSTPAKLPPNKRFPDLHNAINAAIKALGGAVAPKLNWSSPKDATWISRHPNTVKCTSANDIYILLKSSSFISHDLDHAFDDCFPSSSTQSPSASAQQPQGFTPVLVLRSFFSPLPSLEFRCFVKDRNLIAITQRDLNYYAFLRNLRSAIIARCRELFNTKLKYTFPDSSFCFDVYIPEAAYRSDSESEDSDADETSEARSRLARARLIDINPWAPRTDTILFGWEELLETEVRIPVLGRAESTTSQKPERTVRLRFSTTRARAAAGGDDNLTEPEEDDIDDDFDDDTTEDDEEQEEEEYEVELRLVEQEDPAAYNFSSPQYSAHKMPKDVVDASMAGEGGMREFAREWQRLQEQRGGGSSS
ncbi:D123-domain-containing protein [Pseudoneurospora amorphoporcata]|uniref:D123-domain-containing protein n=1 Tax=Pseudoneurospora amorphoporcata TaxID=241081 RepID=A0AAN6NTU0_9PEZI|nr:D123-domain-containing protein [Pseudoneurospora amorphoporcata]